MFIQKRILQPRGDSEVEGDKAAPGAFGKDGGNFCEGVAQTSVATTTTTPTMAAEIPIKN